MPIIRERVSKNYTSLSNRVLRDPRLKGEEKGLLGWLLSHDPDWKIIIPVVQREMSWGRDKTYRILKRLNELGYLYRIQDRDTRTGAFGPVVYFVYSNPDANPSQVNQPLPDSPLPISSKALKERNIDRQEAPPSPSSESIVRLSRATDPKNKQVSFELIWEAYSPAPYMSRKRAERVWNRMSPDDQRTALEATPAYFADCDTNQRKRVSLDRFLRDQIWEGFAGSRKPTHTAIYPGTPEWEAWRVDKLQTGQSVRHMDQRAAEGKAYTVRGRWPPRRSPA